MPMIEVVTDRDGRPFDELARARMILASVGDDTPDVEATAASAASWLMPPARPERSADLSTSTPDADLSITDAQKRLAASYAAVPAWLSPTRAA